MANSVQVSQYVLDETLVRFLNNIKLVKTAYRKFEEKYETLEYATGATLNYRLEENYVAEAGWSATEQAINQRVRSLTVDQPYHVMIGMDGSDLTLNRLADKPYLDDHLGPMARTLAETAEKYVADKLKMAVYNTIGTPGSPINSPNLINKARGAMVKLGIPMDGMNYLALSVDESINLANGVNNFFNTKVNTAALMEGYLGDLAGMGIFETMFLGTQVAGSGGGGAAVNGLIASGQIAATVSSGNTITIKGLPTSTANVFRAGDIIQVAGSYFVNPTGAFVTTQPAQFCVQANASTDGSGNTTVTVSPSIVTSGVYKNIDTPLQLNSAVSLFATHNVSIAYHRNAIVFAAPPIRKLQHGVTATRSFSKQYQISMTSTQGSDIRNYKDLYRMDILMGATINPEYAIRIAS